MKKILALVAIVTIVTSCNRSWTNADRKKFIADCVAASKGTVLEDKGQSYCSCMQPIMEAKYPTVKEANQIKQADMQTKEMQDAAMKCLGGTPGLNNNNNNNNNDGGEGTGDDDTRSNNDGDN